jgi:hypothetical protein
MSDEFIINWHARSNAWAAAVLEADRLPELLEALGCDLRESGRGGSWRSKCPVHGGGGPLNFEVKTGGHTLPIRWSCYSEHCELKFKSSLLGLVRGVLTFRAGGKQARLQDAEAYLKAFLGRRPDPGQRPAAPTPPPPPPPPPPPIGSRKEVRDRLTIPSAYYRDRGYSAEVLERHDVGHSTKKKGRTVVPLYDDGGEMCVGYMFRSEQPECQECGRCHRPGDDCRYGHVRWAFPPGFPKSEYLYNFANAVRSPCPTVLVVEGPGDVWRVEEAGFLAVSPLGCELSGRQADKIVSLDKKVFLCFDNDKAGREATGKAEWDFVLAQWPGGRSVSDDAAPLFVPDPYKDVGEMPAAELAAWLAAETSRPPAPDFLSWEDEARLRSSGPAVEQELRALWERKRGEEMPADVLAASLAHLGVRNK